MGAFSFRNFFPRKEQRRERRKNTRTTPVDKCILIIDDSKTVLHSLTRTLQQGGYKVLQALSGEAGIEEAQSQRPSLILIDIVMPGINGYQATRTLRKQDDTKDTPIILMSGSDQESERFWSMRLGAQGFLAKPIPRGLLFGSIEKALGTQSTSPAIDIHRPSLDSASS